MKTIKTPVSHDAQAGTLNDIDANELGELYADDLSVADIILALNTWDRSVTRLGALENQVSRYLSNPSFYRAETRRLIAENLEQSLALLADIERQEKGTK